MKLDKLYEPMKIGNCEIPNRLVVPAMNTNFSNEDGTATERYIRYHETKAKGGWGLIITEDYSISQLAKGYQFVSGLYNDEQIESHKKLTETVHNYESKVFCQIYHAGRQSKSAVNGGLQPIAPSAIPDPWNRDLPREATINDIHEIISDFGDTALRAKKAGFDGIELHAGHGYLLAEFLSPYANKRSDEYGGSFENRIRIIREIMTDIRSKVGNDFPVIIRFSAVEAMEGGRDIAESRVLALEFEEMGFDALHVSSGVYSSYCKGIVSSMYVEHAWTVDYAAEIKKLVTIPVITANRINEPKMANTILKMDKADFIAMGRGSLADPDLPNKAKAEKYEDIRYCIGCLQGCIFNPKVEVSCLVNPSVGLEYQQDLSKVEHPKDIMIIGAGPAGLQTAVTAATRGHNVTIYDKRNDLGGQFKSAAYPPNKGELATYTAWCRNKLKQLGVQIRLETEVTEELIKANKPDAIVVATGGTPLIPNIPGIDLPHVVTAEDVLLGKVATNDLIVVCGGGEVGGETAATLAMQERAVSVVEMTGTILRELDPIQTVQLTGILNKYGVTRHTNTKVVEITENAVACEGPNGRIELPAFTVVLAFGYKPVRDVEDFAKAHCPEVYSIGGAVRTGNALSAIQEGYQMGLKI
ncbi:NADH:flavin oxidoreductase [Paenibacillus sp. IHB B 3415]|uniref:oxidoreductase n=1 Tax=Paenibacillus sp. IHB B 3415 TaxID=867080 RepID=UPI0005754578|nr:FAD-dependent oxidoreductase [Paenibacillus sp. IHB B 3415]KHL97044.1 NADH:flavin oxidoreductase [Paenibacillus sp. IHB B 3415]